MSRNRLVGGALLLLMFAAGFAAGAAWMRQGDDVSARGRAGVNVNVRMSAELPGELRSLGLDRQQEDSLRALLSAGQRRLHQVLTEFDPRLRAVLDSVDGAIRAVLTPEQRARFDAKRRTLKRDEVEIDTVRR